MLQNVYIFFPYIMAARIGISLHRIGLHRQKLRYYQPGLCFSMPNFMVVAASSAPLLGEVKNYKFNQILNFSVVHAHPVH